MKILGMKLSILLILIPLSFILSGCITNRIIYSTVPTADKHLVQLSNKLDTGKSGIYVLRPSRQGSLLKKDIWIDEKCVGESAVRVYFYTQVDGNMTHKISTESEFSPNDINLYTVEGKNYYIEQYVRLGLIVGGAELEVMKEAEAKEELKELDLGIPGTCDSAYK